MQALLQFRRSGSLGRLAHLWPVLMALASVSFASIALDRQASEPPGRRSMSYRKVDNITLLTKIGGELALANDGQVSLAELASSPDPYGLEYEFSPGFLSFTTRNGTGSAQLNLRSGSFDKAQGVLREFHSVTTQRTRWPEGERYFFTPDGEDYLIPQSAARALLAKLGTWDSQKSELVLNENQAEVLKRPTSASESELRYTNIQFAPVAVESKGLRIEIRVYWGVVTEKPTPKERYLKFSARFENIGTTSVAVQPSRLIVIGASPSLPSQRSSSFMSESDITYRYSDSFKRSNSERFGPSRVLLPQTAGSFERIVPMNTLPTTVEEWLTFQYSDGIRSLRFATTLTSITQHMDRGGTTWQTISHIW